MKQLPPRANELGVDMSPLIDMVFILLIFFMVTSTFVKDAAVEIKRPSARSASSASTKSVRLNIDPRGVVYLDGAPVRLWALQARLRDLFRGGASKEVLLVTDQQVNVERLIEVIDLAKLAGAKEVSVATDKDVGGA